MKPAYYRMQDTVTGDTFDGAAFTITSTFEAVTTPVNLTGCAIKIQYRKSHSSEALVTLVQGQGITITNAALGQFKIDPVLLNLIPDEYFYDIQITFTSGAIKTFVTGNHKILSDYTR